ncbi:MAG: hypothetical protein PHG29_03005 [Prolixibacteraceae bacterium]|nr:hypothetical protein [Prolixibacteraceae bacterium]NLO03750.1 hypothetical protein [Bacteroidales bacterium]
MSKLKEIYYRNIYGVMGTLVFHILLFSLFLLADVDMKGNAQEEEIVIEFPDVIPEPEIPEPEEAEQQEEQVPDQPSEQSVAQQNRLTNVASNRLATTGDKFFDDDYMKEVEDARKLVSDVNNQLSKEIKSLDDIKMPVETTENMDPDSVKNVFYAGESNIVYYLENRYHVSLPIPVYLAQGGGKVIIDIEVNREGKVVRATPRNNPSVRDDKIFLYATAAASRTVFNKDESAPEIQRGTIHYTFIAQ